MDNLTVMRDGHSPGGIDCSSDIILVDDATGNANHALAIDRRNIRACQADQRRQDFHSRGTLGLIHRARHRLSCSFQVYNHAFSQSLGRLDTYSQDAHLARGLLAGYQRANFCRPNIYAD